MVALGHELNEGSLQENWNGQIFRNHELAFFERGTSRQEGKRRSIGRKGARGELQRESKDIALRRVGKGGVVPFPGR